MNAWYWTLLLLEELDRRYTGKPDLRADVGFESKLRGQLDGAEPEVVQLMAEVHYVYYVASRYNISGGKKRERIGEVLGWLPSPVAIPPDACSRRIGAPLPASLPNG